MFEVKLALWDNSTTVLKSYCLQDIKAYLYSNNMFLKILTRHYLGSFCCTNLECWKYLALTLFLLKISNNLYALGNCVSSNRENYFSFHIATARWIKPYQFSCSVTLFFIALQPNIMKALLILFLVSFLTTTFVLKIYYPVGHVFFRGQFIYSKWNISGANFGKIWWIAGVNYKK